MLFLGGFALVTLKNLSTAESVRNANSDNGSISIVSGAWVNPSAQTGSEQKTFVQFHPDGKISGFAGCNRFFGTFVATDTTLEVGSLATTRMACPDAIMQQEMTFLGEIEGATGYLISGHRLTLEGTEGTEGTEGIVLQLEIEKDTQN
jgi:heat shock protein HslJ